MIVLFFILWFSVGFFGIYKWLICEEIGSSIQRYYFTYEYPKKPTIDRNVYIFFIFFFMGPLSLSLWLIGYLLNRKEIIEHKKLNTPKLTLKQIRLKKLKRINRFGGFKRIFNFV
jgi:flagellar biosynthesis protein FlhB